MASVSGLKFCKTERVLLSDRAADLRKDRVGVGTNQAHSADDDNKNYSQHNRVLSDVLALFVVPHLVQQLSHFRSP